MKAKTVFFCTECGNETPKWAGKCPACGAWNTIVEQPQAARAAGKGASRPAGGGSVRRARPVTELEADAEIRFSTGMGELDRVLGGGAVKGSLVLVGGAPGIGKSTLMLQICSKLCEFSKVLYISGEESEHQLKLRAKRLHVESQQLLVLSETNLGDVLEAVNTEQPDVLIVDSIQTLYNDALDAAARLLEQALLSRGATVDRIRLREYAIHPCIGCGYCSAHPGHCVFDGDDVADLFRRMEHADSLILNIPVYFYGPPALLKGFIDRAQIFWEQRREGTRTPRRPAHAVLCAARTRGDRLFEANLLILRCFLDTLGFSLHEPLLLRGVERPTDLLHSQAIAHIEQFGLEAAEQATRFYHE